MHKLLIIEDDKDIASSIRNHAQTWNFEVHCINNFNDIIPEFVSFFPHIVLLDIMLPFYNGYHWCNEIRKISKVPIIFISSASDTMNMIMAMNMGADDFIVKPFDQNILMAKMQALLRRTYDFATSAPILEHRGAILNIGDNTLTYNDQKLSLSKNEFKILHILLENKAKVVSREKLMQGLWDTDSFIDENTLSVNVNRLRKHLEGIGLNDFIITKFGVGYIIEG